VTNNLIYNQCRESGDHVRQQQLCALVLLLLLSDRRIVPSMNAGSDERLGPQRVHLGRQVRHTVV
jgi:hypothetical protein